MKYTTIILFFLSLSVLSSCTKNTDEFDGPSIKELYSDFKVLENFGANRDSVDFANGETVIFTAAFNKTVDWTLTITGNQSGAVKIITGTSRKLDASNASWNGTVTMFPMFKEENCTAQLTIDQVTDTFTVSEKIISRRKLNGFIIADFESGLLPGWTKFIQSGANMDFQVKTDSLAPEGNSYLNMAGTVNWDYLIGLIDFKATAYGSGTDIVFPLNTNPDAVYFNCLIYGVPNTNTSLVLFQFTEDENEDGTFNANTEDQYDYQATVDWVGWKLISIKYSDLTSLVNGQPATPKGNGLHEPNKLRQISMLHLANPSMGFASSKLDLVIFTENGPLTP